MANRLTIYYEKKPCYDIVFASDFGGLLEELQDLNIKERRAAIIADSNTVSLYGEEIKNMLEGNCKKVILHSFPAGEEHKTLDTVKEIYKKLIEEKYDEAYEICEKGSGLLGINGGNDDESSNL